MNIKMSDEFEYGDELLKYTGNNDDSDNASMENSTHNEIESENESNHPLMLLLAKDGKLDSKELLENLVNRPEKQNIAYTRKNDFTSNNTYHSEETGKFSFNSDELPYHDSRIIGLNSLDQNTTTDIISNSPASIHHQNPHQSILFVPADDTHQTQPPYVSAPQSSHLRQELNGSDPFLALQPLDIHSGYQHNRFDLNSMSNPSIIVLETPHNFSSSSIDTPPTLINSLYDNVSHITDVTHFSSPTDDNISLHATSQPHTYSYFVNDHSLPSQATNANNGSYWYNGQMYLQLATSYDINRPSQDFLNFAIDKPEKTSSYDSSPHFAEENPCLSINDASVSDESTYFNKSNGYNILNLLNPPVSASISDSVRSRPMVLLKSLKPSVKPVSKNSATMLTLPSNSTELSSGNSCFAEASNEQNMTSKRKVSNEPRRCYVCDRRFKYPSDLKKHEQIHTSVKKYLCEACGKSFRRLHQLNVHRRIHTGEKPYVCPSCGQRFRHDSTLTMHKRTRHDHLKPFRCAICAKTFGRMSHLRKHQKFVCCANDSSRIGCHSAANSIPEPHITPPLQLEAQNMQSNLIACRNNLSSDSIPSANDSNITNDSSHFNPYMHESEFSPDTSRIYFVQNTTDGFRRDKSFNSHELSPSYHVENHSSIIYQCPTCQRNFNHKIELDRHRITCEFQLTSIQDNKLGFITHDLHDIKNDLSSEQDYPLKMSTQQDNKSPSCMPESLFVNEANNDHYDRNDVCIQSDCQLLNKIDDEKTSNIYSSLGVLNFDDDELSFIFENSKNQHTNKASYSDAP